MVVKVINVVVKSNSIRANRILQQQEPLTLPQMWTIISYKLGSDGIQGFASSFLQFFMSKSPLIKTMKFNGYQNPTNVHLKCGYMSNMNINYFYSLKLDFLVKIYIYVNEKVYLPIINSINYHQRT